MTEAYPLHWPVGYKRTDSNKKAHASFRTSFAQARDGALDELKKMGAKDIVVSTNVPLRRDGLPYAVPFASTSVTDDSGIAVYFTFEGEQRVLCCDAFLTLDDNMQAIRKTINALRMLPQWKVSEMLNRIFTGFKALPENTNGTPWHEILEVKADANAVQIKEAYRKKAMIHHPDRGGNVETFNAITKAYQQGLSAVGA